MSAGFCILIKIFFMAVPRSFPKKWLLIPGFFLVLLVVFSFIPVPKADPSNCIEVKGVVEKVVKGSGEAGMGPGTKTWTAGDAAGK
jgi:hypothetical protein